LARFFETLGAGEVVVGAADHAFAVPGVTSLKGQTRDARFLDLLAQRVHLIPRPGLSPAMLFEHGLVVPDRDGGIEERHAVDLAFVRVAVEASRQERLAPSRVALPVGTIEEFVKRLDLAVLDQGPVV